MFKRSFLSLFGSPREVPAKATTYKRDPLRSVPVHLEHVDWDCDDLGHIRIHRRAIEGKNRQGKPSGRPIIREMHLQLDEQGAFYWKQIDGQTDLVEITRAYADSFDVSTKDAENAVFQFTKMLMRRGLIGLTLPEEGET